MRLQLWLKNGSFERGTKLSLNPAEMQLCSGRYVVIQLGYQIHKSNLQKTSTPVFNDAFTFVLVPAQRPILLLEYYECYRIKDAAYKGFCTVDLKGIAIGVVTPKEVVFSNGGRLNIVLCLQN